MKCYNCHEKDAVFVQRTFTNTHREEIALCADCARELGYVSPLDGLNALLTEYAARLTPFFAPQVSAARMYESPLRTAVQPVVAPVAPPQPAPQIDAELSRQRELNVLREQMRAAAASENFELAMRLRDEIKQMEVPENE